MVISFKVGLKWSMIHFLGRITLALQGFSEKTLSCKLTSESQIFHSWNSRSFLQFDISFSNPMYIQVEYIQVVFFEVVWFWKWQVFRIFFKVNRKFFLVDSCKKIKFVEVFKNAAHLNKWRCTVISFKVGLKWSMIHFLGRVTLALKGFSEKTLSCKLTQ